MEIEIHTQVGLANKMEFTLHEIQGEQMYIYI